MNICKVITIRTTRKTGGSDFTWLYRASFCSTGLIGWQR